MAACDLCGRRLRGREADFFCHGCDSLICDRRGHNEPATLRRAVRTREDQRHDRAMTHASEDVWEP